MKKLIINADDVGLSDAVNEAVKRCCLEGTVTGVSVVSCGARFSEAATMLREIGMREAGVHFSLTGGLTPVTGREDIGSLVDDNGKFVRDYKGLALRYFSGSLNGEQLRTELSAQIRKAREEGLTVTHLDSHEHVQMFPGIFRVVLELAVEHEVPYVRLPRERTSIVLKQFLFKDLLRHVALGMFTAGRKRQLSRLGLKSNDAFFGHFHAGRINENIFYSMLGSLREGVNELVVHPCMPSEEFFRDHPWHRNTAAELDILTSPKLKEYLRKNDITLVSHSQTTSTS
jgi:predicted glycoside hydrolase/deacetylase ChbG (UPF0249 family)